MERRTSRAEVPEPLPLARPLYSRVELCPPGYRLASTSLHELVLPVDTPGRTDRIPRRTLVDLRSLEYLGVHSIGGREFLCLCVHALALRESLLGIIDLYRWLVANP